MDALWNLEDKWKLSTQEALLLFACTAFAVVGLCTVTMLKMKAQRKQITRHETKPMPTESGCGCVSIKRMLTGSARWSQHSKWRERVDGSWRERPKPRPLLGMERSHDSASAVWQKPILMGEKCELPRFSGLILYDERGRLLCESYEEAPYKAATEQEKEAEAVKTTLRDLLSFQ